MKIIKENLFLDIYFLVVVVIVTADDVFFVYGERDEKNITIIFLEMGKNSDII